MDQQVQRAYIYVSQTKSYIARTNQKAAIVDSNCVNSHISRMAQMNISIPDRLKNWVENRVVDGSYASSSDYMRALVRRDQRAEEARMRLQVEIDKGLKSPESDRTIANVVAEGRAKYQ